VLFENIAIDKYEWSYEQKSSPDKTRAALNIPQKETPILYYNLNP
jgi:hypothetical protein